MSDEDLRDRIICIPVADMDQDTAVPDSIPEWCELCAESVWLSPEGQRHRWKTPTMIICIDCAPGEIETLPSSPIEPVEGAKEYHLKEGWTEEEFNRARRYLVAKMRRRPRR